MLSPQASAQPLRSRSFPGENSSHSLQSAQKAAREIAAPFRRFEVFAGTGAVCAADIDLQPCAFPVSRAPLPAFMRHATDPAHAEKCNSFIPAIFVSREPPQALLRLVPDDGSVHIVNMARCPKAHKKYLDLRPA